MTRILLTGGGGAGTQALWDHWHARHELYFADANPHAFAANVPADRRIQVPMASAPDFVARVQALCERLRIDVLIPGVDEELLPLARQHGAAGWPRLLLPEAGFVETMLDKLLSMRAIASAGLAVPKTIPLDQVGDLQDIAFPLILKPRKGRGSRGVMTVQRKEQVDAYLTLHGFDARDVVAQELVAGQEFTVFAYADGAGRLLTVVPVKVLQKRGITLRACTDDDQAVVSYVRELHDALGPSGPYNVQCMLTPQGKVLPFEINPRISTTFCLAVTAGADPLELESRAPAQSTAPLFRVENSWSLNRSWFNQIAPSTPGTRSPTDGDPHA